MAVKDRREGWSHEISNDSVLVVVLRRRRPSVRRETVLSVFFETDVRRSWRGMSS